MFPKTRFLSRRPLHGMGTHVVSLQDLLNEVWPGLLNELYVTDQATVSTGALPQRRPVTGRHGSVLRP